MEESIATERLEQFFNLCDRNGSGFIEDEDLTELCDELNLDHGTIKADIVYHLIYFYQSDRNFGTLTSHKHQFYGETRGLYKVRYEDQIWSA